MKKSLYQPHNEVLCTLLKDLRKEAGLFQEEVADRLDKPQSFVSKYESGDRRLDGVELYFVCAALNTSLSVFATRYEKLLKQKRLT